MLHLCLHSYLLICLLDHPNQPCHFLLAAVSQIGFLKAQAKPPPYILSWSLAFSSWRYHHQTHPKSARAACSSKFESILRNIVSKPSQSFSWELLLSFAQNIIWAPLTERRKINLASAVNKRTQSCSVDDDEDIIIAYSNTKRDPTTSKLAAVSANWRM